MTVHLNLVNTFSRPANADLSASQYRALYVVNDGDVDLLVNSGTPPVGVLLNKPAAAKRAARVAGSGSSCKMEAGATIDEGQRVVPVAGGRGSPAGAGAAWDIGLALTPAASGEMFTLLIDPSRGTV